MAKKQKAAAQAAAEEAEADPVEETVPKKKGKKKKIAAPVEAEPVEATEEPPKKKKKKAAAAAEAEPAEEAVEEAPKKKKKKKAAAAEEEPVEEEEKPKKKKKKVAAEEEEDAEEKAAEPAAEQSGLTVFVGGLPWKIGEDVLRKDFEECGKIAHLNLVTDRETGKSKGIAFITYEDKAGVKAALEYDGTDYGGRSLAVSIAEDRGKGAGKGKGKPSREHEVFLKGLDKAVTEEALQKDFGECGGIEKVSLPLGFDGKCKGFAWIIFKDEKGLEAALKFNGTDYGGKELFVERSGLHKKGEGKGSGRAGSGKGPGKGSEFEVFVKNFAYEIDEATFRRDFAECGEIASLKFPMKSSDKCMGFAWVTFKNKEAVEKALEYNGDDYGGRRLLVEKAGMHTKGK